MLIRAKLSDFLASVLLDRGVGGPRSHPAGAQRQQWRETTGADVIVGKG